jgi:flagellar motor switch protein FliM
MRTTLSGVLGRLPSVEPTTLELVRFADITAGLVAPASVQLFRMPPLKGQGMLVVSPSLAALLLEASLGGDAGRRTPLRAREFSALEQRLLERLGTRVLDDLRAAWRPLVPVDFAFVALARGAALATVAAPPDVMLLIELAIVVEAEEAASLRICIPNASLDPIRGALEATPERDAGPRLPGWSDALRELLAPTEVEIVAELGTQRMRLGEVLGLRAGDVLTLRTGRDGPVIVRVEGQAVFVGAPGVARGSNAVRITANV